MDYQDLLRLLRIPLIPYTVPLEAPLPHRGDNDDPAFLIDLIPDQTVPDPFETTLQEIARKSICNALAILTSRQRQVLLLIAEGYTLSQISRILDCHRQTVKDRVDDASKRLKNKSQELYYTLKELWE